LRAPFLAQALTFLAMAASHPDKFKPSFVDEGEVLKLIGNLLLDCAVLQWRPVNNEEIPTPNTNEIMVLTSFFQRGFGLLSCEFLRGLLHHYKIKQVHLNPNSILQIIVFDQICECYLTVHPNFPLFKHYFMKYQSSAAKRKMIGGVSIQTRPQHNFIDLPLKTSLKGWHKSWFYYKKP
jgi:hypothetical protein